MACPPLLPGPLLAWVLKDICPPASAVDSKACAGTKSLITFWWSVEPGGSRIHLFFPFRTARTCADARSCNRELC